MTVIRPGISQKKLLKIEMNGVANEMRKNEIKKTRQNRSTRPINARVKNSILKKISWLFLLV